MWSVLTRWRDRHIALSNWKKPFLVQDFGSELKEFGTKWVYCAMTEVEMKQKGSRPKRGQQGGIILSLGHQGSTEKSKTSQLQNGSVVGMPALHLSCRVGSVGSTSTGFSVWDGLGAGLQWYKSVPPYLQRAWSSRVCSPGTGRERTIVKNPREKTRDLKLTMVSKAWGGLYEAAGSEKVVELPFPSSYKETSNNGGSQIDIEPSHF